MEYFLQQLINGLTLGSMLQLRTTSAAESTGAAGRHGVTSPATAA